MRQVLTLICVAVAAWSQQFLAPFTAADGAAAARRTAQQSGIAVEGISFIFTTADTSLLSAAGGSFGGALQLNFSFERGTNTLWLYTVRGRTSQQRDTSITYAVVKFVTLYQALPLIGVPGLPDTLGASPVLPQTFMNSDVMVRKLAAEPTFQYYRSRHPASTLLAASLSVAALPNNPTPVPLWSVLIGEGSLSMPRNPLTCFVLASDTTGTAQCFESPTSVPATDQTAWSIFPNPASDLVLLRVPAAALSQSATVDVCTPDGSIAARYLLSNLGAGEAIAIPVSSLASGVYFVRYRSRSVQQTLPIVVSR